MRIKGKLKIHKFILQIFFVTNSLKLIKKAKENFEEIILIEFIDNNFLFKIKKVKMEKVFDFYLVYLKI